MTARGAFFRIYLYRPISHLPAILTAWPLACGNSLLIQKGGGPYGNQLAALTAGIIAAYVGNHVVPVSELPRLIADVHAALQSTTHPVSVDDERLAIEVPKPPVPVKKSIQPDYIVCLEDGKKFKSLKRYLTAQYNMTPNEYRKKWDLPPDYPMVAPNYAVARSRLAREMGLGQSRSAKRKVRIYFAVVRVKTEA